MDLDRVLNAFWRRLGLRRAPRRATIMLASGLQFDLLSPHTSPFDINDVAHGLSNTCRFTGQCRTFYSVAQHSLIVSLIVPPEHALEGLMHDGAEAFIGDVAKPLKNLLPDYKRIEDSVEAAVFERFGLPRKLPACVKHGDMIALHTEQRDFMGAPGHAWTFDPRYPPLPQKIIPMTPEHAKRAFLQRYAELTTAAQQAPVRQRMALETT